jgi:hypothetical protein
MAIIEPPCAALASSFFLAGAARLSTSATWAPQWLFNA